MRKLHPELRVCFHQIVERSSWLAPQSGNLSTVPVPAPPMPSVPARSIPTLAPEMLEYLTRPRRDMSAARMLSAPVPARPCWSTCSGATVWPASQNWCKPLAGSSSARLAPTAAPSGRSWISLWYRRRWQAAAASTGSSREPAAGNAAGHRPDNNHGRPVRDDRTARHDNYPPHPDLHRQTRRGARRKPGVLGAI